MFTPPGPESGGLRVALPEGDGAVRVPESTTDCEDREAEAGEEEGDPDDDPEERGLLGHVARVQRRQRERGAGSARGSRSLLLPGRARAVCGESDGGGHERQNCTKRTLEGLRVNCARPEPRDSDGNKRATDEDTAFDGQMRPELLRLRPACPARSRLR